ncbi:amidohydrolase [Anaerorhabdus sp.]|uniref:amidohydrolase n=1 Tax=Anaerorhabdus sp. TaxID=1872524 RepID=UPI002FCA8C2B
MKELAYAIIDKYHDEFLELADTLFKTPELGYKEVKTKQIIQTFLTSHGIQIEKEYFQTGFQVTIANADKPHIGLIAELDAIPTIGHPCSNPLDNAAHSCGHSTQVVMMIASLLALKELIDENKLTGKVTLFFCPAEEFIDIEYRKQLIENKTIYAIGGKQNMIIDHIFDDVDCCLHAHGMGEFRKYRFNVKSSLAGFIYKKYHFEGKASHAAMAPSEGINALSACNLFLQAQAMLRETFLDSDMNRVHGIITNGGDVVNSIPSDVVYEAYVRSFSTTTLMNLNDQLSNAAKHCAYAIGAKCEIEEIKGYFPFNQDIALSDVVYQNMLPFVNPLEIQTDEKSVASGDIGDLSLFKPTIQFGYTGFKGTMHGKNLEVSEPDVVYNTTSKILVGSVIDLLTDSSYLENIHSSFRPQMTIDEYIKYLES